MMDVVKEIFKYHTLYKTHLSSIETCKRRIRELEAELVGSF